MFKQLFLELEAYILLAYPGLECCFHYCGNNEQFVIEKHTILSGRLQSDTLWIFTHTWWEIPSRGWGRYYNLKERCISTIWQKNILNSFPGSISETKSPALSHLAWRTVPTPVSLTLWEAGLHCGWQQRGPGDNGGGRLHQDPPVTPGPPPCFGPACLQKWGHVFAYAHNGLIIFE